MIWQLSHRAHEPARLIADRHYNRQKPGTPQFVPPGRCLVLLAIPPLVALWVTSWPFGEYVKHRWPGAWVNSCFRKECAGDASAMILDAVAATRTRWPDVPELGLVTFVDSAKVPPTYRRGKAIYGYCYLKAGFAHVGFTAGGLWAWQLLPDAMPSPRAAVGTQLNLMTGSRPLAVERATSGARASGSWIRREQRR